MCVCVCVRVCWPLPISISFSFLIHRHRRHRSASRRRGRLLAARFLFSVLRRRRRLRSSPNDEPVCLFFFSFFFNNKKTFDCCFDGRPLANFGDEKREASSFRFRFVSFFFVYCWSEPSPSTVIIESNGRAVKSRGVARNAAPPLDGHRRRRRRPRRRSIADRISSSFIVSGFRQSERERDK